MSRKIEDRRRASPLYRKVNTTAHNVPHGHGGDFRDARAASARDLDANHGRMQARSDRGCDYTPLFRFLLSKVGSDWDEMHSEAVRRLDREEPIFWLVARHPLDRRPYVRVGASSYYSGLYIDDDRTLQVVDPTLTADSLDPTCACCTHTFNGVPFTKPSHGPSRDAGRRAVAIR